MVETQRQGRAREARMKHLGRNLRAGCCGPWVRLRAISQVLPFDIDAARRYAELAVTARNGGRGFPTPDDYIAAIAASRGFIVASRDAAPYEAAGVAVINPWEV